MAEVEAATPEIVNENNNQIGDQDDNGRRKKHEHTPIEELYDLSKPIKRVRKRGYIRFYIIHEKN